MPSYRIEVPDSQSYEKLTGFFVAIPEKILPYLERFWGLSGEIIKGRVAEYPPTTEANFPGRIDQEGRPEGYYERGKGSWRPILTLPTLNKKVALKEAAGKSLGRGLRISEKDSEERILDRVYGYTLRPTSENLGKSWYTFTERTPEGIVGSLGNTASYASYVQGFLDEQASIPASRDWMSLETAIDQSAPEMLELADVILDEFIADNFPEGTESSTLP